MDAVDADKQSTAMRCGGVSMMNEKRRESRTKMKEGATEPRGVNERMSEPKQRRRAAAAAMQG